MDSNNFPEYIDGLFFVVYEILKDKPVYYSDIFCRLYNDGVVLGRQTDMVISKFREGKSYETVISRDMKVKLVIKKDEKGQACVAIEATRGNALSTAWEAIAREIKDKIQKYNDEAN